MKILRLVMIVALLLGGVLPAFADSSVMLRESDGTDKRQTGTAVGSSKHAADVTQATLTACEDQTNQSCQVVSGPQRTVQFSSVTSATSSAVLNTVHGGKKTFVGQIINSTSETKAITVAIYGNQANSLVGGIFVCRITLPSTATTLQLQDNCPTTEVNFPYWFYTVEIYTSASAAPFTLYANSN